MSTCRIVLSRFQTPDANSSLDQQHVLTQTKHAWVEKRSIRGYFSEREEKGSFFTSSKKTTPEKEETRWAKIALEYILNEQTLPYSRFTWTTVREEGKSSITIEGNKSLLEEKTIRFGDIDVLDRLKQKIVVVYRSEPGKRIVYDDAMIKLTSKMPELKLLKIFWNSHFTQFSLGNDLPAVVYTKTTEQEEPLNPLDQIPTLGKPEPSSKERKESALDTTQNLSTSALTPENLATLPESPGRERKESTIKPPEFHQGLSNPLANGAQGEIEPIKSEFFDGTAADIQIFLNEIELESDEPPLPLVRAQSKIPEPRRPLPLPPQQKPTLPQSRGQIPPVEKPTAKKVFGGVPLPKVLPGDKINLRKTSPSQKRPPSPASPPANPPERNNPLAPPAPTLETKKPTPSEPKIIVPEKPGKSASKIPPYRRGKPPAMRGKPPAKKLPPPSNNHRPPNFMAPTKSSKIKESSSGKK